MAGLRMTMVIRNPEGLRAKVQARTARQKVRVRQATATLKQEETELVESFTPKRTRYMVNHLVSRFTQDGYNYFVGWLRGEFVGEENPVTKQVVSRFYAVDVIHGTRFRAGNDVLAKARAIMRPRIRELYRRALSDRLSGPAGL